MNFCSETILVYHTWTELKKEMTCTIHRFITNQARQTNKRCRGQDMKDNAIEKRWYSSVTVVGSPKGEPRDGKERRTRLSSVFRFCILVYSVTEAPEDNNK